MRQHHFPGFLIAIEGIDGSGKTTQAHLVQEALQAKNLCVIRTKEPTTGYWGQMLRDSANTGRLSLEEEVETFIKDRKEHVEMLVNPELASGHIVIADRYYFSNMAYQGARGIDPDVIMTQNEMFAPEPDLLVVLDIDPKGGLARIKARGDRANHFETTGTLRKAREIFNSINKPYLFSIDATQEPSAIRNLIIERFWSLAKDRIGRFGKPSEAKKNPTPNLFGDDAA